MAKAGELEIRQRAPHGEVGRPYFIGLVLAAMLVLVGCYSGPNAAHFVSIVDELGTPAGWEIAQTVLRGPDQPKSCNPIVTNECPAAIRHFSVSTEIASAYAQAKDVVSGAGFTIGDEGTTGCATGSSTGPPCGFFADRGDDQLYVGVYASPTAAGLDNSVPEGVVVTVRAYASN